MTPEDNHRMLLELTTQIVAAHVGRNQVSSQALPALIDQVFQSLRGVTIDAPPATDRPMPMASNKRSVFPDYIICLEDGRQLKTLKRHLRSTYGLSPEQYREKWNLPADYPMVAPNYAQHRSQLAKQAGLGRKPAAMAAKDETAPEAAPAPAATPNAEHAGEGKRTDHTAASVFAGFPGRQGKAPGPDDQENDGDGRKKRGRKPFSKQLARTMRS